MAGKRRTYIVGVGYGRTAEEIRVEDDLAVVHLGDPPFTLTLAPPGDKREVIIVLSDGSFLTDLQWLTPKRAKGRLLFSLLEGAVEAVEYHLDMADAVLGGAEDVDPESEAGEDVEDPVDQFIEQVNQGLISELALLDFEKPEDLARITGATVTEEEFRKHKKDIEEIVEEARIRGIPVFRAACDPDEYLKWLAAQKGLANDLDALRKYGEYLRDRQKAEERGTDTQ